MNADLRRRCTRSNARTFQAAVHVIDRYLLVLRFARQYYHATDEPFYDQ